MRGAVAGIAVSGTIYFARRYALSVIDRHPEIDGPETLGSTILIMLYVGIPTGFVLGLLVAWAARLRHPWAVSLMGLLISAVLSCGLGMVKVPTLGPGWTIGLVIVAYAAAAVLVERCAQPWTAADAATVSTDPDRSPG
jgi:hypothetical protein